MTNKKSQRNQRRNRKHRTLRGGGWFDGWPFGRTEQPVPSSEPKKSWFEGWFSTKPAATTMTANPVAEKKTDDLNPPAPVATEKKTDALNAAVTGQPGSATGGKRRNKTEKNKNKNRKNKH
jgi:hypothetical protein